MAFARYSWLLPVVRLPVMRIESARSVLVVEHFSAFAFCDRASRSCELLGEPEKLCVATWSFCRNGSKDMTNLTKSTKNARCVVTYVLLFEN